MGENESLDRIFLLSSTSTWVNEDNVVQYGLLLAKYTAFLEKTRNSIKIEELESANSGKEENICRYCGVRFTDLIAHLRTHRSKNSLRCNQCGKSFLKKRDLRHHLRLKHSNENQPDNADGATNGGDSTVIQYNAPWNLSFPTTSASMWAFKCSECGKRFRTRGYLRNHVRMHVNKGKNSVSTSTNALATADSTASLTSVTPATSYECEICHKKFKSAQLLLEHIPTHSPVNQPIPVTNEMFIEKSDHSGIFYECGFCQRQFKSKGYLRFHLTTHSRQNLPSSCKNNKTVQRPENSDTFQCMLCNISVHSESELFDHMKRHPAADEHVPSKTNNGHLSSTSGVSSDEASSACPTFYRCTVCDKEFRTKGYLRNHLRTHGNGQVLDGHHDSARDPGLVLSSEKLPLSTSVFDSEYNQENHSGEPLQGKEIVTPDNSIHDCHASDINRTGGAPSATVLQAESPPDIKEEADPNMENRSTETICESSCCETEFKSDTELNLPVPPWSKQEQPLQRGIAVSPQPSGDGATANLLPYQCGFCKREFRTKGYLRNHLRTHTNEISDQNTELHYSVHIEEDSANNLTEMPSSSTTGTDSSLDVSIQISDESSGAAVATPLVCRYCKKDFKSEGRLRYHYLNTHSFPNIPGLENLHTDTSINPPPKKQINQQFSAVQKSHHSESLYSTIQVQATRENSYFENPSAGITADIDDNPFKCNYCSKAFRTEGYLRNHLRSHAVVGSAFGMDFREMGSSDIEMFGGGNGSSFKCQYCEREFRSKGYLRNHLRTHTADK